MVVKIMTYNPQASQSHLVRIGLVSVPCINCALALSVNQVVIQLARQPDSQNCGVTDISPDRLERPTVPAAIQSHSHRSTAHHQIQPYHPHWIRASFQAIFRLQTSQIAPASQVPAATIAQGTRVSHTGRLINSRSSFIILDRGTELASANQVEGLMKLEAKRRDDSHV